MQSSSNIIDQKILARDESLSLILEAVKTLTNEKNLQGDFWVLNDKIAAAKTLKEALFQWGWDIRISSHDGFSRVFFVGEHLCDDAILFSAMAPFLEKDSFIAFRDEFGESWRYVFDGKGMKEQSATIHWD